MPSACNSQRITISLALAITTGMIAACGSGAWKQEKDPPQKEVEAKPFPEPVWASPDRAVRQGDLEIQITRAIVEKARYRSVFQRDLTSDKNCLIVWLRLTNISQTKKIEYRTWSSNRLVFGRDEVELTDNFGNHYNRALLGSDTYLHGAVGSGGSIYPEKSITEGLAFEVPVEKATYLNLVLPAKNYESDGLIRFRIPASFVTRER